MFGHPFNRWYIDNIVNNIDSYAFDASRGIWIWMLDQGSGGWFGCQAAIFFWPTHFLA